MLIRFTIVLTMLAPTPTLKEADAAYNAGDYRKALDLFRARAADPSVHPPEALRGVHDSLVALHGQTGEVEHLCDALKVTRKMLRTGPFADAGERGAWVKLEGRDITRIKRAGITCAPSRKKKSTAEAPVVAANTHAPTAPQTPAAPTTAEVPTPEPAETPADKTTPESRPTDETLLAVTGVRRTPDARTGDVPSHSGEATSSRPPPVSRTPVPPPRRLVIAGSVTLGVGLGITAAAGYIGGVMLDTWRESTALYAETGPIGTEAEADRNDALARDYHRQLPPMLVTAIVGGSAVIAGAVLVGVGAKRLARATSRTALLPTPGGLVLRARF